jgi:hypothetical protein
MKFFDPQKIKGFNISSATSNSSRNILHRAVVYLVTAVDGRQAVDSNSF